MPSPAMATTLPCCLQFADDFDFAFGEDFGFEFVRCRAACAIGFGGWRDCRR